MDGDGAFAEELLHHFVVAFGDHFDDLFVGFLGFIDERVGNFLDLGFAVAIGGVEVRFHGDQIDDPAEAAFGADGQLERHDSSAKYAG